MIHAQVLQSRHRLCFRACGGFQFLIEINRFLLFIFDRGFFVLQRVMKGNIFVADVCPLFIDRPVFFIVMLYAAGDLAGSLEAQYRLNPVRLSMDLATFPVATKDMANMMGLDVGRPYRPTLPSDEKTMSAMRREMLAAGLLKE